MKHWKYVIAIGAFISVCAIAFLFALNGRYRVFHEGQVVFDSWTRTLHVLGNAPRKYEPKPRRSLEEIFGP